MRSLLLSLSLLFSLSLSAQKDSVSELSLGIGGGFFNNEINLLNTLRNENKVTPIGGVELGVTIRYFNNKLVGFSGELNYSKGGWNEVDTPSSANFQQHFDYVSLQLLTQFTPGKKAIRPLLQAGPYLSFPVQQAHDVPSDFTIPSSANYYGEQLPFRPNYGLCIGAGLYIDTGNLALQLEGRYLLGFSDLIKSGTYGVTKSIRQAYGIKLTTLYSLP